MNELLLWMSARRSGTVQDFRAKAAQLGAVQSGRAAWRTTQWNFEKLAHAEFGPAADAGSWCIAPPVLAAGQPELSGRVRAVLCGARTPRLVDRLLGSGGGVSLNVRAQAGMPDLIEASASNLAELKQFATQAGVRLQSNASLAVLCCATPPKSVLLQPASLPVGGWAVSAFSKFALEWQASTPREAREARSGLFRFRSDYETVHIIAKDGRAWTCDPAAAKYRILRPRNRVLAYTASDCTLTVRATCRPPLLVERALVLCSGLLPEYRDGALFYRQVDRAVAQAAAVLLGQRL
ncbi:hypothetical protein ABIC33_006470 [Variovorax sp. 1140]|uniref:hypothetical protein n=1 Tax=Variovorax atrisoli TaxID=3394203 RepID=UPI0033972EE4